MKLPRGTADRPRRNVLGDDVDEAADRVGAVQERRRPAHDFDPLRAGRVDGDAVIARLAGQIAHALAVLKDQDAIAAETANHRPRRRRTEAPRGNAGLALQRVAKRHLELLRQLLAGEHRRRLERLELTPRRVGADGDDFSEVQVRIDRDVDAGPGGRGHGDFSAPRRVAGGAHGQVVGAGGTFSNVNVPSAPTVV